MALSFIQRNLGSNNLENHSPGVMVCHPITGTGYGTSCNSNRMDSIEWTFTTRSHHPDFFLLLLIYLLHKFIQVCILLYSLPFFCIARQTRDRPCGADRVVCGVYDVIVIRSSHRRLHVNINDVSRVLIVVGVWHGSQHDDGLCANTSELYSGCGGYIMITESWGR